VRLRKLHAKVFGPHRDRDLSFESNVTLVFGPNESGKSSFRAAIETLLYGFEPARRDDHPLVKWSEGRDDDLHLEADLAFDDGTIERLERTLMATGKSRNAPVGEPFTESRRGNTALPIVDELPRKLYRSIYAIEIDQLTALESGDQADVDHLLLPESNTLQLRPLGKIQQELRKNYGEIWRPTRAGNQIVRGLVKEQSEARKQAAAAEQKDTELREALAEVTELDERLAADRAEKLALEKIERDAPYEKDLWEHFQRVRRLGEPIDLSPLEDRPLVDPARLREEIETLEEELIEPTARLAEEAVELDESARTLLGSTAEIRYAINSASHIERDARELADKEAQTKATMDAAVSAMGGALIREPTAADVETVTEVPLTQLRSTQATWAREWENAFDIPEPTEPPFWPVLLAVVFAGAAGVLVFLEQPLWVTLTAIGVTATSAIAAFFVRKQPEAKEVVKPSRPLRIDDVLRGIPVAPSLTGSPVELLRLIDVVAEVQRIAGDAVQARAGVERLRIDADNREKSLRDLCGRLSVDTGGEALLLVERLREQFEAAESTAKRADDAAGQRRQDQTEIDARTPTLERKRAHFERLERTLRKAEPDASSLEEAYRRACERRDELEYVERRRAELSADSRWEALQRDQLIKGEESFEDPPWREDIAADRAARLGECNASIESANQRLGDRRSLLQNDIGSHAARARDAVNEVEESLVNARRERDRLALLDSILVQAERAFRDEHQPDVLRRASRYLSRVTNGRYSRLDYSDDEGGGLRVTVKGRSEPVPVDSPISRGTLDQIFLCLRLGLLDHLDREREKLPLILDDALVRMDDARRGQVYSVLGEVARKRQVFLLTCHSALAAEAELALGIERIDLTPGVG